MTKITFRLRYIASFILLLTYGATSMAGISTIKKIIASTQTKFDWQASESAPQNYPMKIISGDFSSVDGSSLYVPDGKLLHHGWGWGVSSHVVGPKLKSLPNRLDISFFSYTENQFYSGSFELPYKKILALFQAGHYSPKDQAHVTYIRITVGIGPGGAVSVWVNSLDRSVDVFFGYAEKVEGNWKLINDNPKYPRDEYVRLGIEETLTPDALADLHKNGIAFGLWERYHKRRYHWQPQFTHIDVYESRVDYIKYFNGELDFIDLPLDKKSQNETRAVPSVFDFTWARPPAKPLRFLLEFDEDEIFKAFETLGSQGQALQFEMSIIKVEDGRELSIRLHNDKETIILKNTKIDQYGIPE